LCLGVVEAVALVGPPARRAELVAFPGWAPGAPPSDANAEVLAATPAGARFLHEMTADDVARGLWALQEAGTPASVDPELLAAAVSAHGRVLALRAERRAVATRLVGVGARLAQATP